MGPGLIGVLTASFVMVAVLAIYGTTDSGQRLIRRLGLRRYQQGAAPDEDRDFLLRACGGSGAEVESRLSAERMRSPDSNEAQLYRRAIRTYMNARRHEEEAAAEEEAGS